MQYDKIFFKKNTTADSGMTFFGRPYMIFYVPETTLNHTCYT